jgi:hypothetical protein
MAITIIPEALEVSALYSPRISIWGIKDIIAGQVEKRGRFGLTNIDGPYQMSLGEAVERYIEISKDRETVENEKKFVKFALKQPNQEYAERGLARAKSMFKEGSFNDPEIALTAGLPLTDACVLRDGEKFGINLSFLAYEIRPPYQEYGINIENYCIHEGSHIFRGQLPLPKIRTLRDMGESRIFEEGLAIFSELPQMRNENVNLYLKDVMVWEALAQEALTAKASQRKDVILKAVARDDFIECNGKRAKSIAKEVGKMASIPEIDYRDYVGRIFLQNCGPAYAVGFNMLNLIVNKHGLEKVRELACGNTKDFFAFYRDMK